MVRLYRSMQEDGQGFPVLGPSARTRGIRPGRDAPAVLPAGPIHPGEGGLSVSPDDPMNLPYYRRPSAWNGTGADPVWEIGSTQLGTELVYRPDPDNPAHGYIEPARHMTVDEFQTVLSATQPLWKKTP